MESTNNQENFIQLKRPHIALITNHGYGGVNIPFGGAPDTGGQNVYVNSYARALDRLGYKVTIYARGGFPFYESDKIREGQEFLTSNVRYVYVPGGGDEFIRKEDISIALLEELEWIYNQIQKEAGQVNLFPWEYYDMMNSHYWDAGIVVVSLVVKWQNDLCSRMIKLLTEGVIAKEDFDTFYTERHFSSVSKAPDYSLGKLLLEGIEGHKYVHDEEKVEKAYQNWVEKSSYAQQFKEQVGRHIDWMNLRSTIAASTIQLRPIMLAKVLGKAILDQPIMDTIFDEPYFNRYRSYQDLESFSDLLNNVLKRVNKHVWTPHSLGVLKEWNFRNKSPEVKRNLKFRERRSHERVICDYTPAFGATSFEIANSLVANYGVSIEDVLFFPPGVDINIFHDYSNGEINKLVKYLEEKTGLPATEIESHTILFETSRMDITKRKDVLIESFAKVVEKNDDGLLFIGGGPENGIFESLEDIKKKWPKLKDRVFLLGFIPQEYLPLLFDFCDIYISASEMEGFGMSVAQAAFDGKAIISSDKIPFTSFYIPEQAIIVPAGDIDGFADGIDRLLNNKEKRESRGERIRKKARSLEWGRLVKQFILDLNTMDFDIPITEMISQDMS